MPGEGEITLYKSPHGEITLYKGGDDEMPPSSKLLGPLVNQTYCKTLHTPESIQDYSPYICIVMLCDRSENTLKRPL